MLEITLRPQLLAYQNTLTLEDRVLVLDLAYHLRTDSWWLSVLEEDLTPIVEGRRMVEGAALVLGGRDPRLPGGVFLLIRLGERRVGEDAEAASGPGLGELGTSWRLVYYSAEELLEGEELDLLAPRSIKITGVV